MCFGEGAERRDGDKESPEIQTAGKGDFSASQMENSRHPLMLQKGFLQDKAGRDVLMRHHLFGDFCLKDPEGPHPIDRGVPRDGRAPAPR